jgi:hypothetical protein
MSDDTKAIEAVIKTYFDGLYDGDVEKLATAFHATSALTSVGADGKLAIVTRAQWFDAVAKRPSAKSQGQARADHILMIDQPGPTMAFVKVKCQLPPRYFVDQLSLLKVDGRWQIVQKVFQAESR